MKILVDKNQILIKREILLKFQWNISKTEMSQHFYLAYVHSFSY